VAVCTASRVAHTAITQGATDAVAMKPKVLLLIVAFASSSALLLVAQQHQHTSGEEKSTKTKLLEAGAELLQGEGPIGAIHAHVCGFHFYNGEPHRQVRAHHYCSHQNEEVLQCVIYDSHGKNARLIGIEYIISEALFKQLPEEEKKLWHSHQYEVKSGQLVAPNIPDAAEKELMKKLVNTYGKTWHTWQIDRGDTLPLGTPKLMMGFTADGQGDPKMVEQRDKDLGVDTTKKREKRMDIEANDIVPGANAWQHGGPVMQIPDQLPEVSPKLEPRPGR
jgi:hypothetical protein